MAVLHQAYCFDVVSFHGELRKSVVPNGSLSIDLMLQVAKQAVDEAHGDARDFLRLICFDEEWFEAGTEDAHYFTDMYLVALAPHIRHPCPIANLSFAALELALPELGMDSHGVRLLLVGQWLHSLAASSGVAAFAEKCSRGLRHVSWLSNENVARLKSMLLTHQQDFEAPNRVLIESMAGIPNELRGTHSPEAILRNAYRDLTGRLDAAHKSKTCLILINDVTSYQRRPGPDPV